ncbi:MAG: SGNH/GDSL hydrolase family protein [Methylococcales bacterium]
MSSQSGKSAFLSNLGASVGGVLLFATLFEAGLRLVDFYGLVDIWEERRVALNDSIWMKHYNPDLLYTHRPDYYKEGIRYTERGGILRPDDVAEQSDPGTFRIAVLGDSVVAAIKLSYRERVFTQLENLINQNSPLHSVEILNFGVDGYSSLQEATLLGVLVDSYAPDMLVLQYCMNDFYPSERPGAWFREHSSIYVIDLTEDLMERYRAIGYPTKADYWKELYRDDEEGWRNIETGFTRIARYAADHEIPALLVIFPLVSTEGWYAGEAVERHRRVAALGQQKGFRVVDLLPVYAEYDIATFRFGPSDTFHPNALGHRIAAEAIGNWFRDHKPWEIRP